MATVTTILGRVKLYVADSLTDWTDPSVINDFIFSAYRDVERLLRASGVTMFRRTSDPISLAAGITTIARTAGSSPISPTAYPSDLLRPLEIVEKVSGGSYVRMVQSSGVLEDRATTTRLAEWDWKYDQIVFPAASGTVTVKIEYEAALPELTGGTDVLLIPDGDDAVTYLAAARALRSRGGQEDLAVSLETAAQQQIAAIAASELAVRTSSSGRWGTQDQGSSTSVASVVRIAGPLANSGLQQGQAGIADWELVPFIRAAYRTIARELRAAGVTVFRRTSDPIKIASGTKLLGRSGGVTNFPADLLRPMDLMEREFGPPASPFSNPLLRMSKTDGLMEDRVLTDELQEWEWKDDALRFVGAATDREVVIEYEAALPELLTPNDTILIPDAVDTIALLAASYCISNRAGADSSKLDARAASAVAAFVASEVATRAAAGGRWGAMDQTSYVTVQSIMNVATSLVNNDPERKPLSEAQMLPFIRAAYADVIAALRVERSNYFVKKVVIEDVPSTNTSLGPATTPALPADFVRPLYVREQWALHDGSGYTPMQVVSLTAVDAQQVYNNYRGYYWWASGTIYFPGTGNRPVPPNDPYNTDFEIIYEYEPAPLLSPQSRIAIAGGGTAVAMLAAAYATASRQRDASQFRNEATILIGRLVQADKISRETASGQFGPKRPPTS